MQATCRPFKCSTPVPSTPHRIRPTDDYSGDRLSCVSALILTALLVVATSHTLVAENWPHWRGPARNGSSAETGLPVSWGASCKAGAAAPSRLQPSQGRGGRGGGFGQEGRPITPLGCSDFNTTNVAWRLALPAYSGSTPIIWGDTIFLNVATGANNGTLELWAVDRQKQAVSWKRPLADTNHMERKQNMSSPSPVTDGRHVWVMTGVGALKAFDFSGKEIWSRDIQKDYGRFGLQWGYASSPLLQGDFLYVQVLHGMKTDDPSYILKIDKMTGKTVWRVERATNAESESPDSYTTPLWVEAGGRPELIITGGDVVSAHDPQTGKEYWRADVLNPTRNTQLPHHCLTLVCQRARDRADAEQPARGGPSWRQRRRRQQPHRLDVRAGAGRANAGHRRQPPLHRSRQRRGVRARREDGRDGLRARASATGYLQRLTRPGRRQDLRDHRGRGRDHRVQGRTEVRNPVQQHAAR